MRHHSSYGRELGQMKRTHIIATAATVFSILAVAALLAGCGSPDQDYEDAFRLDDVPRFRQVLKDHPDHPRAEEAHARLGVLLWQAVQQKPDTATLKLLIHQYSHADFAAGAIALLDSLNWGTARHANTVQSYRSYCDSFPDGAYSDKAQSLIEELVWDSVEVENSIQAYGNYCAEFPHGIYIENAKKLIEELSWQEAVDAGSMEMLEAFIAKYPDSQLRNAAERRIRALRKQKFTEVFEADDVERLRQLDDGNLEETTRNLFWWPPILLAADARSERLITYLIENGADVNARGADQATALHLAVRAGDLSVVGLLLQNNADIEANIEPEMSSVYVGDGTMTYHEAPPTAKKGTPLIWAAYYNQPQIISYLIKQGANVNADDGYGCTPVHFAAKSGSMDMLNELVAARADWRAASENNRRSTPDASPLHYASSVEIAQYFLNEGISLNMVSDLGMPIHAASRYGYIDVVRLYLSRGADVNAVCSWEI